MKRILFLFSLALLAGGLSAFTGHRQHKSDSASALHYFYVDGTTIGNYIGDYDPGVPAEWADLKEDSNCEDDPLAEVCALGFDTMNPSTIEEGSNPLNRNE